MGRGWGVGWEAVQKRGTHVNLRFIHIVVWQISKHIFKAIICQLTFFNYERNYASKNFPVLHLHFEKQFITVYHYIELPQLSNLRTLRSSKIGNKGV